MGFVAVPGEFLLPKLLTCIFRSVCSESVVLLEQATEEGVDMLINSRSMQTVVVATLALWSSVASATTLRVDAKHPKASDENPGTRDAPFRTIAAATAKALPGDTIEVAEGVYRETVQAKNPGKERIVLMAVPGHRPVISGGESITSAFAPTRVQLRAQQAGKAEETPFDADAWRKEIGLGGAVAAAVPPATGGPLDHSAAPFLGIYSTPMAESCQVVFADGKRLAQIGLQGCPIRAEKGGSFRYREQWRGRDVSDLRPGSFHHDRESGILYVWLPDGADPKGHQLVRAARGGILRLTGTWTLSGFDIQYAADGQHTGGSEAAVVVSGSDTLVEHCRIRWNEFIGLIHHGHDGVLRNCVIAENGLCGISPSFGWRMLIEGNEFYGNGWRGNVLCGHNGNKITSLKDTRILRNYFHDGLGLWLDINVNNTLVAENRFERCPFGVYFEISCWGVIANNVFRDCGRGIWVYSANTLVAHNVLDGCGEGITLTTSPRGAHFRQRHGDPYRPQPKHVLFATRNNLMVNNIIVNSTGSYLACNRDSPYGQNNQFDYNMFAWTLAAIHNGGNHIKFMAGWDDYYGRLPFWHRGTHSDRHSVIADATLLQAHRNGRSWGNTKPPQLVGAPGFADPVAGDYRLRADSPLKGRGVTLPLTLDPVYIPSATDKIVTRSLANTEAGKHPERPRFAAGYGGEHYRLQPIPKPMQLVALDGLLAGDPGLNETWKRTGRYPTFRADGEPYWPDDTEWMVRPVNRLANHSFEAGLPKTGPWHASGIHEHSQMACVNLMPNQRQPVRCQQTLREIQPETEYILWARMHLNAPGAPARAWLTLKGGDKLLGEAPVTAAVGEEKHWRTYFVRYRSGKADADPAVGNPLTVEFGAQLIGKATGGKAGPVAFARWDDFFLLSGAPAPE